MQAADHGLIDIAVMGSYLESQIAGFRGLRAAKKFDGGQSNPTFLLSADSGQYVLRRQPPGKLLKSAHAVDREYRVIEALSSTNVPVPRVHHLCEDRSVMGCLFYVMSYEEGRIFWDPALPDLNGDDRGAIYDDMNRVLANLHSVDIAGAGLSDFGRPNDYFARQVARWSGQYAASATQTIDSMDQLIAWLPANQPADDGQVSLTHGDYRLDNLVFHPRENRIIAVLDWELSTLGHPYADLAYQCMQLRLQSHSKFRGLGGRDREALGIPSEREYVARYCDRRGLGDIPDWNYYLVFSFFRLAAILQGVLKRALDGNASGSTALEYGAMAPALADMAVALLENE